MKRNSQWIIACTVLWLSACSTLPRPVGPDNEIRRQAAVQTRWIGVPKIWTGKCPATHTSDWSVSPLVPLNELKPSLAMSVQKAGLDRFCVYEYKGTGRVSRELMPPRKTLAQLRSVEPDRLALSSMASLQEAVSPQFSLRFFEQVQSLAPLPSGATARVRLVFLDTHPTGDGIPKGVPKSRHGYTLGHIAGRLANHQACGLNCTVEVASRLALPVVRFNPATGEVLEINEATGGVRGTFTDLTLAIVNEIDHWQKVNSALPPESRLRLVLNLSVGWDGEKFGGWGKEDLALALELDSQNKYKYEVTGPSAVYRALKVAADLGVLVVAAAGNERGGPDPTGLPLLPGGWEKPFRLSTQTGEWGWENIGAPLIYAASGVDGFGHQLVTTRWRGEAPRVAYADHVAVPDLDSENNEVYTATLTGTSVASAVISTIAAIAWSYQPNLAPKQVMAILDQSGTNPLNRHHDFADPQTPQGVKRITLCRALAQVWSIQQQNPVLPSPGPTCANIPEPTPIDPSGFNPSSIVDLGQSLAPLPLPFRPHRDTQDQSLTGPQPGLNPCPNCVVDPPNHLTLSNQIAFAANKPSNLYQSLLSTNDYSVLVELPSPEWGVLKGATLEIFKLDDFGKRMGPPSGKSFSLPAGDTLKVTFPDPEARFQAALTFTLATTLITEDEEEEEILMTVVNPLLVDVP
jgi:hypothetical protein